MNDRIVSVTFTLTTGSSHPPGSLEAATDVGELRELLRKFFGRAVQLDQQLLGRVRLTVAVGPSLDEATLDEFATSFDVRASRLGFKSAMEKLRGRARA